MRVNIGDSIIIRSSDCNSNGNDGVCAAIVTQEFSFGLAFEPGYVHANVTAFPPFMTPQMLGSVAVFPSEEAARSSGMFAGNNIGWPAVTSIKKPHDINTTQMCAGQYDAGTII